MKRFAILAIALSTVFSSVGCCGWPWPWPCNNGAYGPGFMTPNYNNCPGGNCGVPQRQVIPGQTGFYQSYDSIQSAQIGIPVPGQVAAAPDPIWLQPVHRTAMLPLETLPTFP